MTRVLVSSLQHSCVLRLRDVRRPLARVILRSVMLWRMCMRAACGTRNFATQSHLLLRPRFDFSGWSEDRTRMLDNIKVRETHGDIELVLQKLEVLSSIKREADALRTTRKVIAKSLGGAGSEAERQSLVEKGKVIRLRVSARGFCDAFLATAGCKGEAARARHGARHAGGRTDRAGTRDPQLGTSGRTAR